MEQPEDTVVALGYKLSHQKIMYSDTRVQVQPTGETVVTLVY